MPTKLKKQPAKKRGGAREGSGRKPKGTTPRVSSGIRLSPEVMTFLRSLTGLSINDFVEGKVRASVEFRRFKVSS